MKTKIAIMILLGVCLLPIANAEHITYNGRIEQFTTDPPVPTPDSWYTYTDFDVSTRSMRSGDDGQLATYVCSGASCIDPIQFTLTTGITSDTYEFTTVYHGDRDANTKAVNMGVSFGTASSVYTTILSVGWDSGGPAIKDDEFHTIKCGSTTSTVVVENTGLSFSGQLTVQYDASTNAMFITDGIVSCVSAVSPSANVKFIRFTGTSAKAAPTVNTRMSYDYFSWNDGNGTFTLEDDGEIEQNAPSEFDTGLKAFVDSIGFRSPESQFMFALILIGIATVIGAGLTSIFGDGPGRTWFIHGLAVLVGVFTVLLLWLKLWIFAIAVIMGTFGVRGAGEFINTVKSLAVRGTIPQPVADMESAPIVEAVELPDPIKEPEPEADTPEDDE